MTELETLRVSLARVAQALGVNGRQLDVLGKVYEELANMAETQERGWNDLAGACVERAEHLHRDRSEMESYLDELEGQMAKTRQILQDGLDADEENKP
jgi:hypothetical protein